MDSNNDFIVEGPPAVNVDPLCVHVRGVALTVGGTLGAKCFFSMVR